MRAAESVLSDPAVHAAEGDDRIRTGVVGLSTDPVYEGLGGSNLASPLAVAYGLVLAAHWGWWVFALYVLVSGLGLGWLAVRGEGRA